MSTRKFGQIGEQIAEDLLKGNGYKILTKNFRSRFGEIDIIALDSDTLVFIEVKTRWSKKFGSPEEAVLPNKIRKIKRTAEYFSLLNPHLPKKLRIDVVAIEMEEGLVKSRRIIKVV